MGPNCLQRLSADDSSREKLSSLHDEEFYMLFCHQLIFFSFFFFAETHLSLSWSPL